MRRKSLHFQRITDMRHKSNLFLCVVLSATCCVLSCREEAAPPPSVAKSAIPDEGAREAIPDEDAWETARQEDTKATFDRQDPFVVRSFDPVLNGEWIGAGVAYGPYRDGQRPDAVDLPNQEQIEEDLELIVGRWKLLRLYGCVDNAESVLNTIRNRKLPMRVMLGAWIGREKIYDEQGRFVRDDVVGIGANGREIRTAIRLAKAFPDVVVAISVGSESQVDWSDHRIDRERLIQYIRRVRAETTVPVTTADDLKYWKTPDSKKVAEEVDFIVAHIYAMWHGKQLDTALEFTTDEYEKVQQIHPDRQIVLGEAGWATKTHPEGLQAELIKGRAGEAEQKTFFDAFTEWSRTKKIPTFYFEAFDENWKGGPHPDEVEKHWGLFRADRTPKLAIQNQVEGAE